MVHLSLGFVLVRSVQQTHLFDLSFGMALDDTLHALKLLASYAHVCTF